MKHRPATIMKSVAPIQIKAVDVEARRFRGLVSTFDVDLGGDRIKPGAFNKTLADWRPIKDRKPIHLIDQHGTDSVTCVVGRLLEAAETDAGLECEFEMLPAGDPTADAVWLRIIGGFITGLSIGYTAVAFKFEKLEDRPDWDLIRIITELQLWEVSAVIWPMNDDARIELGAMKAELKNLARQSRTRKLTDDERKAVQAIKDAANALLTDEDDEPAAEPAATEAPQDEAPAPTEETSPAAQPAEPSDGTLSEHRAAHLRLRLRSLLLQ